MSIAKANRAINMLKNWTATSFSHYSDAEYVTVEAQGKTYVAEVYWRSGEVTTKRLSGIPAVRSYLLSL